MQNDYQVIAIGPDRVGESPLWCQQTGALWWVDIESRLIKRWRAADQHLQTWLMPERVACIGLTDDARVLAAFESSLVALSLRDDGSYDAQELARVRHPAPAMRFNDGRCDASGRFWVGSMAMDTSARQPLGGLYCLDERGLTGPHVSGLYTSNGTGVSPDGRTFYLSDSHPLAQTVWAFDLDAATGQLSQQRVFIDMKQWPGRPDGAAVDAQGHYWICGNDAGQVHCFDAAGQWLRSLAVPFPKPAMCCFGGDDMQTLFVTSIVPAATSTADVGLSGAVVALRPGVKGRAEPRFSRWPGAAR
jgi:sugar lactone lactonase YvrE